MTASTGNYLYRLDHLRFFAALLVMLFHFRNGSELTYLHDNSLRDMLILCIASGKDGVSLFLVLSGFLFTYLAQGGAKPIVYSKFIYNRILRIYPLLTLIFLAIICVQREQSTPMDVLRLLLLQLNTGQHGTGWGNDALPIGLIWTVAVEFQFYLLFPVLMRYVREQGYWPLLGVIALLNMFKLLIMLRSGNQIYFELYHSTLGRLDQFLVGIISAMLYLRHPQVVKTLFTTYGWPILGALVLLFLLYFRLEFGHITLLHAVPGFFIEAVLWALVILTYIHLNLRLHPRLNRLLCALGERSYSIYLLHFMLGEELLKHIKIEQFGILANGVLNTLFLVLPITLIVADIAYRCVERPFMAMRVGYFKTS